MKSAKAGKPQLNPPKADEIHQGWMKSASQMKSAKADEG